jgi:flavin-dependent dehydrogenase
VSKETGVEVNTDNKETGVEVNSDSKETGVEVNTDSKTKYMVMSRGVTYRTGTIGRVLRTGQRPLVRC